MKGGVSLRPCSKSRFSVRQPDSRRPHTVEQCPGILKSAIRGLQSGTAVVELREVIGDFRAAAVMLAHREVAARGGTSRRNALAKEEMRLAYYRTIG